MEVGDIVYLDGRHDEGVVPAGEAFWAGHYPELAELYEFQFGLPEGMKRIDVPPMDRRRGLIPHVIASSNSPLRTA